MKNVRIFYRKGGRLRFVSHLDTTRFMARAVRRAGLPVWYTEGFHTHLYLTFALPLSLGFESDYEVMDLRLTEDDYPLSRVEEALNTSLPPDISVLGVAEPVCKTGKIASAGFTVRFHDDGALAAPLGEFLKQPEILCEKKTKRGEAKQIDLAPMLKETALTVRDGNTVLTLKLPAGPQENINPELLLHAFFENAAQYFPYRVIRTGIFDDRGELFR